MGSRAGVLVLGVLLLAACGTQRSVEAFCDTIATTGEDLEELSGELLEGGMLDGARAAMDMRERMLEFADDLADVAPDEVREDAELVAAELEAARERQHDHAGDLLGGLASAFTTGLELWRPVERVDEFAQRECGQTAFAALGLTAPSRSGAVGDDPADGAPEEPEPDPLPRREGGDVIFTMDEVDGEQLCPGGLTAATGDVVIGRCSEGTGLHAIDLSVPGLAWRTSVDGDEIRDVQASGGTVVVTWYEHRPPEGLGGEQHEVTVTALDADDGEPRWERQLFGPDAEIASEADHSPRNLEVPGPSPYVEHVTGDGAAVVTLPRAGDHDDLVVVEPDGTERWRLPVELSEVHARGILHVRDHESGARLLVDVADGQVVVEIPDDGGTLYSDRCSPFLVWTRAAFADSDWEAVDARDGSRFVGDGRFGSGSSVYPSREPTTSHGIVASTGEEVVSVGPEGRQWAYPDEHVEGWWWVDGELVMENLSGEHFRVDPATGDELGPTSEPPTLREDRWIVTSRWRMTWDESDPWRAMPWQPPDC